MIALLDNAQILVISKKLVNKLHSVGFITSLWLGITRWITNEISNFVKVNADISGQRTIPDTSCIAPKNESTTTHFSIFIIPIRIAIHTRNFKAIRCFVPGLAW